LSLAKPNGEPYDVEDRPGAPTVRAGALERTYDLAIYVARQSGVPVGELAKKYKVSRKTIWYRCRKVAEKMPHLGGAMNAA
jgi:hypothetical protein